MVIGEYICLETALGKDYQQNFDWNGAGFKKMKIEGSLLNKNLSDVFAFAVVKCWDIFYVNLANIIDIFCSVF